MLHSLLTLLAVMPSSDVTATPDEVLSPYIYVFIVAWSVAFVMTPVMQSIAMYYHVIDEPDLVRKLHGTPVAYLGGEALFLGCVAGLQVARFVHMAQDGAAVERPLEPGCVVAADRMAVV